MSKYKVGDKVKIREDLIGEEIYNNCFATGSMEKYRGSIMTVSLVLDDASFKLKEDELGFRWTEGMLDKNYNNNNIKGEEKMNEFKTKKMVDLWAEKKRGEIYKNLEHLRSITKKADKNYVQLRDALDNINNVCKEIYNTETDISIDEFVYSVVGQPVLYSKDTFEKIQVLDKTEEEEVDNILSEVETLTALLSACETYEQEMAILQKRGIVNSDFVMEFEAKK